MSVKESLLLRWYSPSTESRDPSILLHSKQASHTLPPSSPSHIFILSTFPARLSASFFVSCCPTAAKTRVPRDIELISSFSTVTEAECTRCNIAFMFVVFFPFFVHSRDLLQQAAHDTNKCNKKNVLVDQLEAKRKRLVTTRVYKGLGLSLAI